MCVCGGGVSKESWPIKAGRGRAARGRAPMRSAHDAPYSKRNAREENVSTSLWHSPTGSPTGSPTPTMWAQLPTTGINWQDQFLGLVHQHAATVTGLFYGHTHMDEVRLLYDRSGQKVTQVAISSPGVTPLDSNNPGFKLISYDPASKEPTDFVTYYTTPSATTWGAASYRFSDAYGCGSKTIRTCLQQLTPAEVNTRMNTIFTVMNGFPTYATGPGIPVKFGQ